MQQQRHQVVVSETGGGRFQQRAEAAGHSFLVDEPQELGGLDSGPTPYDLILGALGACTAMTVRMYADQKGWPLEGVEVRLSHGREHARDCETCEIADVRLDLITRELSVWGPLSGEQRGRLLEIAEKCPVHRTLAEGARIETALA